MDVCRMYKTVSILHFKNIYGNYLHRYVLALLYTIMCICHHLFIYSFLNEHLNCFHFFIKHMNFLVYISMKMCARVLVHIHMCRDWSKDTQSSILPFTAQLLFRDILIYNSTSNWYDILRLFILSINIKVQAFKFCQYDRY